MRRLISPWRTTRAYSATRFFSSAAESQDQSRRRLRILACALEHVPRSGWTEEALARGAVDSGLPAVAHGIFKRGPIELVEYFLEESAYETARIVEERWSELVEEKSPEERMIIIIDLRLRMLEPYIDNWPQAMTLGLHPNNVATTARNLALLTDEMCMTVGLKATDARWYTDRGVVGTVYAAAEIFMLTDKSPGFSETRSFVRRRVNEAYTLSSPNTASSIDNCLKMCTDTLPPNLPGPLKYGFKGALGMARQGINENAGMVSASAQVLMGALSTVLPAGNPLQRSRFHDNPHRTSESVGTDTNASPIYGAPQEDKPANLDEIKAFDSLETTPPDVALRK